MGKRAKRRKAKAKAKLGFVPVLLEQSNGRKRGAQGLGLGAHQDTSPMARATLTPDRREIQRRKDRKAKQQGWG
jgi:hypothetical protein